MADVIALNFNAYAPLLTAEAQAAYEQWRAPYDGLMRACRETGNWPWAGELAYRLNAVTRLCRKMPQPVSEEHMLIILDAVADTVPAVSTPRITAYRKLAPLN